MSVNKQKSSDAPPRKIFINPFYKKPQPEMTNGTENIVNPKIIAAGAHINPLFLSNSRSPAIHMNPNFLKTKLLQQQIQHTINSGKANTDVLAQIAQRTPFPPTIINPPKFLDNLIVNAKKEESLTPKDTTQKIISKSRTKIVREPVAMPKVNTIGIMPQTSAPLIRINSRKLVRRTHLSPIMAARPLSNKFAPAKLVNTVGKYKLDRRLSVPLVTAKKKYLSPGLKFKRKPFVARYALQRSNSKSVTFPRSIGRQSVSNNKKIQMLNINGVLYRSTGRKLQRKDANSHPNQSRSTIISTLNQSISNKNSNLESKTTPNGRVLFVHGTKFVLDKSGYKLTRMTSSYQSSTSSHQNNMPPVRQRRRLDIGGLTYIASTTQDVFVRTRNHLALAHLNMAKNRSLQFLTRRFVKTNIPCAIFQRIGKCRAHDRGKCNKVHDRQQVTICPRFLRGVCHNSKCLLSHNVSLAKMPVCRFYLQGVCVRTDCPYLHKKLSVNADICPNFLRGYCQLAESCNKRHEFLCPEYERNGKCELFNCLYCKSRKRKCLSEKPKQQQAKALKKSTGKEVLVESNQVKNTPLPRYFIGNETDSTNANKAQIPDITQDDGMTALIEVCDSDDDMPSVRPKVGALPAFIPLS
ncbi:zinc finger CCCH domain-containing protein 3 [Eurosta solidaginis]|uniref:zinc finger CCCH domain-containing protein 3 n=1 Tax=Eurosta solidaginis TaxID=178769 RepID=UPI0035308676